MKVYVLYSSQPLGGLYLDRFHGIFISQEEAEIGLKKFQESEEFKINFVEVKIRMKIWECNIGDLYLDYGYGAKIS